MATLKSLAEEYATYIRLNIDNIDAVSEITRRINGLKYTTSGKPLTDEDKARLVQLIEDDLSPRRVGPGGTITVESQDSSELVRLIQMIRTATLEKK